MEVNPLTNFALPAWDRVDFVAFVCVVEYVSAWQHHTLGHHHHMSLSSHQKSPLVCGFYRVHFCTRLHFSTCKRNSYSSESPSESPSGFLGMSLGAAPLGRFLGSKAKCLDFPQCPQITDAQLLTSKYCFGMVFFDFLYWRSNPEILYKILSS